MYLEASLLLALVPFGSSQLIDVPPIENNCQAPAPCSNLYFYNATDQDRPLEILQGDHKEIKTPRWSNGVKNVAIVRVFGEHGSYTIYKKKNFKGESLCLDEVGTLVSLEDEGFESTVIRSVKYSSIPCQSQAGIPPWAIAVAVLVVLLVAVAIFLFYRQRRQGDPVATEEA